MEYAFEIWIPIYIKNQKSKYSVSQYGRVINTKTGRILKPQKIARGYLGVNLSMGKKSFTKQIHRLVAIAFLDNPNKLPQVDHLDGNKHNNRVNNLEWVTPKVNIRRAYAKGLIKVRKGSEHNNAKYTDTQIISVCNMLIENTLSYEDISRLTNVSKSTISHIKNKSAWKHITSKYDFSNYNKTMVNQYK